MFWSRSILHPPQLPPDTFELPILSPAMSTRHSSSSPSSDFSAPPPITASVYNPSIAARTRSIVQVRRDPDAILGLRRQEKAIQEELQTLLDAQSEGLFKAIGAGTLVEEDVTSTGTSTPTLASSSRPRSRPIEEPYIPRTKTPSLKSARRGIYRAIQRLAAVKAQEAMTIKTELHRNEAVLGHIGNWESKRDRLKEKIEQIEHASSGSRLQDIQHEALKLETDIRELEDRLRNMKARHHQLLEEAKATESSVQSRLSSYKSALSLLESDIQVFLSRPPDRPIMPTSAGTTFSDLPPNRRTLGLAREHWGEQYKSLDQGSQLVSSEREALEEGAAVWRDVIVLVNDFETTLGAWLQQISASKQHFSPFGKTKADATITDESSLEKELGDPIQQRMDEVMSQLEYYVALAENKNWKLLVCCIGAELEAFKQATGVLRESVLGPDLAGASRVDAHNDPVDVENSNTTNSILGTDIKKAAEQAVPQEQQKLFDTDDEPDPTLLLQEKDGPDDDSDPGVSWQ